MLIAFNGETIVDRCREPGASSDTLVTSETHFQKDHHVPEFVLARTTASEWLRGAAAYGPSKRALDGYVKVLGREVAPDGVVVSALQPGAYQTPDGHWDEIARERPGMLADFLRHHQALGRVGTIEEIAPLGVFMCAQQASFCSGSLMQIDGGTM
jgi:3-oxoacyl-[acyl-carrier protein] reductase